jgi:hypothetical protein
MFQTFKKQNILKQWFYWHFFDVPKKILQAWKNFLFFNLNYFSVIILLKTLFSTWRKYQWSYGKGFEATKYLEVFFSNLISRILGAIVRSFLILAGLIVEIFIILTGLLILFGWLFLPLILFFGFIFGIKIIL